MVSIRKDVLTKLTCLMAMTAMVTVMAAPAAAQQYRGSGNREVGTIGDLASSKLNPKIKQLGGLNFRTLGMFGDSDGQIDFSRPDVFIFGLPNFAKTDHTFDNQSFEDYLEIVANSYELSNVSDYLFMFQLQNEVSAVNPGFFPTFEQVLNVHRQDFVNGGGFLPLSGDPIIPTDPDDLPKPFEPLDPIFTTPLTPAGAEDASDTSAATLLADSGILTDDELDDALDVLEQASASQSSQQAANVSIVPEPATLGLLAAGGITLIGRRRR